MSQQQFIPTPKFEEYKERFKDFYKMQRRADGVILVEAHTNGGPIQLSVPLDGPRAKAVCLPDCALPAGVLGLEQKCSTNSARSLMAIGADGPIRASAISASPSGASAPVRFSQDEGSLAGARAHRWESY
jgi:hypothetical protein